METSPVATNGQPEQSTFSWAGLPAKVFPSPDREAEWMTRVATLPCDFWMSLNGSLPPGLFSRMSPVCCPVMVAGTLAPSSEGWQSAGMGSPTAFWTLSISAWPNDASVCSLSDVLEEPGSVPRRFFLTPRACAGILRRAEKRGKELPEQLRIALEAVAGREQTKPATAQ